METSSFTDDLRRYAGLIWHWAWLIALATLLAGAAAYLLSKQMTPVYQAMTTLLINEAPANRTTDYSSIVASERQAQTYAQLMTKTLVLQGVIDRLGLDMQPDELREMVQVQPLRDTTLVEVRVEDTDPAQAALIANTLLEVFSEQIQALQASRYAASKESLSNQLGQMDEQIKQVTGDLAALGDDLDQQSERDRLEANQADLRQTYAYLLQSYEQVRLAEAQSTSNVIQAEPAVAPEDPVRPRTLVNTILAALVGMMLAMGFIFLREALDDTLKEPDEITEGLGLPILGLVMRHAAENGGPITAGEPRSLTAEAFRSIRTNIQYASVDRALRTLLVTSPSPAEGKSTVAANLAVVMAQGGRRVALVDADLRRPQMHTILRLSNRAGLSSLFVEEHPRLQPVIQPTPVDGLCAITSGETPPNPAELLGSEKMAEILELILEENELVVIDSPPVMAVTDASVLAPRVDGVVLILKPGVTQMAAAQQSVEQLQRVGANLLGVILNDVDVKKSRYSAYYYKGYYHASEKYGEPGKNGRFALPSLKKKNP